MNIGKLMCAIFIPIGVVLFIVLMIYLIGNVYNGMSKRRNRAEHSWYELTKTLKRSFDLIPSVIQNVNMDKGDLEELKDIYSQYQKSELKTASPKFIASLDQAYQETILRLMSPSYKNEKDALEYVVENRKYLEFSIPLYNHNVRDYQRFKNMLINRTVAKMFKFNDIEEFVPDETHNNTTLDFRLGNFIKEK